MGLQLVSLATAIRTASAAATKTAGAAAELIPAPRRNLRIVGQFFGLRDSEV